MYSYVLVLNNLIKLKLLEIEIKDLKKPLKTLSKKSNYLNAMNNAYLDFSEYTAVGF